MKKKLLVFGYTLDIGGAEKALVDTIKILKDKCDIDLYLLQKKGELLKDIPSEVKVYEMRKNIFIYALFRYISFFRKIIINKIYNKKEYDVVFGYMEGRCGTWVADIKSTKQKKYAWIHNDVFKFDIGIPFKEIVSSYNKLDKIICVSKESKDNFCKKYNIDKDKVKVIYNYINEDEILKKSKEFKVKNNVTTFVNVAKMRDQKRQDRLIKAAIKLRDENYKFKIQLIGDGPNLNKINDMVKQHDLEDYVEVLGLKENPYPYIKNSDYFVLCSYMEGYGIVIKEALLFKKKIITTDVVGPKEILKNGKYGIIIKNEDDAVYYALKRVLDNPEIFNEIEKNLKNYKSDNEDIKNEILNLID